MNRRLLFRFAIPALVVGSSFFTACLISIRYIHHLQANLTDLLAENVRSLQAAQELEISVRKLRFHNLLYLLERKPERLKSVEEDQTDFEEALEVVRKASRTAEEQAQIAVITAGYQAYKQEQTRLRKSPAAKEALAEAYRSADAHQVRTVVEPCQDLVKMNNAKMEQIALESERVSHDGFMVMLFLGLAGPAGGLLVGYGLTRGLMKSIHRLSVRVQDIAHHLDRDVGSIHLVADGDIRTLEEQMKFIVPKVEAAAEQLQKQQRELLRTEQLSQVGQLAAGVAHEIRNPLTGIKLLIEAAVRPHEPRPLNQGDLQIIHREVKRLEQTVQSFLDFARLPTPSMAPCDMRDVIDRAWRLVESRARKQQVKLNVNVPPEPVIARVDAGQMTTVLVNLLLNAIDALGSGGTIEAKLTRDEGGSILLSISDNGPGVPPEAMDRIFAPFATNKPHGTGLGLYVSARILKEHGGAITARNRPEGGAAFTIALPGEAE